jgi:hypothetical protein
VVEPLQHTCWINHASLVRRDGTALETLASEHPSDSSLLVGVGILVACPFDTSGRPLPRSLGTAKDSSTRRGTPDKLRAELPWPTTHRDRSLSDVAASVPLPLVWLSLRVLLPAPLLPSERPISLATPVAFFAAPLVVSDALLAPCIALLAPCVALLASYVALLASFAVLLPSSVALVVSYAALPAS